MLHVMVAPSPIPLLLKLEHFADCVEPTLTNDDGNAPQSTPVRPSEAEFQRICAAYDGHRIELSAQGVIEIMPPTGGETGRHNAWLTRQVGNWTEAQRNGVDFDSSTLFSLPNGAKRSPDAAWVRQEVWDRLTPEERAAFPPICPDFVIELRSPSDRLPPLKAKLEEYIANGAQLGWLIDPLERKVYIYRPTQPVECLEAPTALSGEAVLPGFTLPMTRFWEEKAK